MCLSYRYVFPTGDTATSRATSSQVGVMSPHNINLMGRKYNYNYEYIYILFVYKSYIYIYIYKIYKGFQYFYLILIVLFAHS